MKIKDEAQQLLEDFGLYSVPVNPIRVCEKLGIEYREQPYDNFDGTLIVLGNEQIISVNSNIREAGRRAYTCAHELGHYHFDLGSKKSFECSRDDVGHGQTKIDPIELRANEFASELLMPTNLFQNELKRKLPSWELIEELSATFGTSLQATANKFVEHSCWIMVVKNGVLQRYSISDFNDFKPRLKGIFNVPQTKALGWQKVSADMWLFPSQKTRDKNLLFWPLAQNQYGESMVLLWDQNNTLLEDRFVLSNDEDDDY